MVFIGICGALADLAVLGIYGSLGCKSSNRLGFLLKLTKRDFTLDYPNAAVPQPRLYLGPISPYTQFTVESDRSLTPALRLGAALWVRRLTDNNEQGPFDTAFQDHRAHSNRFPPRKVASSF